MKRAKQVTRAARSSSRFDAFWSRCGFAFTIPTTPMAIVLDHMIVPTRDKEESARFFARIFGVPYEGAAGNFAPVRQRAVDPRFRQPGQIRAASLRLQSQ